jgi:glycine dehydrogenase
MHPSNHVASQSDVASHLPAGRADLIQESLRMPIEFNPSHPFTRRHIGPDQHATGEMLKAVGSSSLGEFVTSVVPAAIRAGRPLDVGPTITEDLLLTELRTIADKNAIYRSLLGMGYADCVTPPVILRNILENPGWYTAYTPYQAEVSQGRLEALLNYQTLVIDLTAMQIANASLLDEGTASAEAMAMFSAANGHPVNGVFFVSFGCHPQTIAVVQTRASALGITVVVGDHRMFTFSEHVFGALIQYPATDGAIHDYAPFTARAHAAGSHVAVATDLLSLTLLKPPGEFGADAVVGNSQRFGIPMGCGGPHAAFLAAKDSFKRIMPGRIIGVSIDAHGNRALRMALQTREQHIRREKATSNICTAQVLLAVMAGMYAVYHGPEGLRTIATRIHDLTRILGKGVEGLGHRIIHTDFFDTLRIQPAGTRGPAILKSAEEHRINLRQFEDGSIGVTLDERATPQEVDTLLTIFGGTSTASLRIAAGLPTGYRGALPRTSQFLTHPVFHRYHAEHEMLRYIHALETKDIALNFSMIPLGSCTMKLNGTTEMIPVTWPEFSSPHPFAPARQLEGYRIIVDQLTDMLKSITGFAAVSFQPNSGAQGEYTGLLVIRAYHQSRGEAHRTVCLIPSSAHGTNPASAVMAGMEVVIVRCDDRGNIDVEDLRAKAEQHHDRLAALMVTYPSTHGVFEEAIKDISGIIHRSGGQVYMDGANMNALVGLCHPAELGADVCHINLHKTFCIPHGGGGPGMGPIAVASHLASFLPGHPLRETAGVNAIGPVSSAPWGSANILLISWAYIRLMGGNGLTLATSMAILNANYMAKRLENHYPILYRGASGRVAHEFIVDLRGVKESSGVEAEDVAKRLMDYGFHAPTVSFPVAGTLMIEPTESESKEELDRFCDALIAIRNEIKEIEEGAADRTNNVLKNAPHTAASVVSDSWDKPYNREKAAFPSPWTRERKFWPSVGRVNNVHGDRNLVCSCPPVESYEKATP